MRRLVRDTRKRLGIARRAAMGRYFKDLSLSMDAHSKNFLTAGGGGLPTSRLVADGSCGGWKLWRLVVVEAGSGLGWWLRLVVVEAGRG